MELLAGLPRSPATSLWVGLAARPGREPELESRAPREGPSGSIPHRTRVPAGRSGVPLRWAAGVGGLHLPAAGRALRKSLEQPEQLRG